MKAQSQASNFIRHRVRVRMEGFKPERLISRAMEQGAVFHQISCRDETEICFTVSMQDLKRLKKLAGSRYKFTKVSEKGAVPTVRRLQRSRMMIAGIALFALVFFAQTLFIREIQVIGCRTITETALRETLREEGLYEGAYKDFDCDEIERKLFQVYDNIVWARVAYEGNYVEVQIAESEQLADADGADTRPCSIVAEQDCYIEQIYTYRGRACVKVDDFVKKGGILISGRVPIEHPSYPVEEGKKLQHYTHAGGKIVARVPYYFSFYMESAGSEAENQKRAGAMLRRWIKENVPEKAEILKKDFHFAAKKNIIRVYGTVETRQQVGIEKEIVIDKHQRRTKEDPD